MPVMIMQNNKPLNPANLFYYPMNSRCHHNKVQNHYCHKDYHPDNL